MRRDIRPTTAQPRSTTTTSSSSNPAGRTTLPPRPSSTTGVHTTGGLKPRPSSAAVFSSFDRMGTTQRAAVMTSLQINEDDLVHHPIYREALMRHERRSSAPTAAPWVQQGSEILPPPRIAEGSSAQHRVGSAGSTRSTAEGMTTRPTSAAARYSSRPQSAASQASSTLDISAITPTARSRPSSASSTLPAARRHEADALEHLQQIVRQPGFTPSIEVLKATLSGTTAAASPSRNAARSHNISSDEIESPVKGPQYHDHHAPPTAVDGEDTVDHLAHADPEAKQRVLTARHRLDLFLEGLFNERLVEVPALATFVKSVTSEYERFVSVLHAQSSLSMASLLRSGMARAAKELQHANKTIQELSEENSDLHRLVDELRGANEKHTETQNVLEGYVDELRTCVAAQANRLLMDANGDALLPDDPQVGPYTVAVRKMATEIEHLRIENEKLSEIGIQQVDAFTEQSDELELLLSRANDFQHQAGTLKSTIRVMKTYIEQLEQRLGELSSTYFDRMSFAFEKINHESDTRRLWFESSFVTQYANGISAVYRNLSFLDPHTAVPAVHATADALIVGGTLSNPPSFVTSELLSAIHGAATSPTRSTPSSFRKRSNMTAASGGGGGIMMPATQVQQHLSKVKFRPLSLEESVSTVKLIFSEFDIVLKQHQQQVALVAEAVAAAAVGGAELSSLEVPPSVKDLHPQRFPSWVKNFFKTKYGSFKAGLDVAVALETMSQGLHEKSSDLLMYRLLAHGILPSDFPTQFLPRRLSQLLTRLQSIDNGTGKKKNKDKIHRSAFLNALIEELPLPVPLFDVPSEAASSPTTSTTSTAARAGVSGYKTLMAGATSGSPSPLVEAVGSKGAQQLLRSVALVTSLTQESKTPLEDVQYEPYFDAVTPQTMQVRDALVRSIIWSLLSFQDALIKHLSKTASKNFADRRAKMEEELYGISLHATIQNERKRAAAEGNLKRKKSYAQSSSPTDTDAYRSLLLNGPTADLPSIVADERALLTQGSSSALNLTKSETVVQSAPTGSVFALSSTTPSAANAMGDDDESLSPPPPPPTTERMLKATTVDDDAVGWVTAAELAECILDVDHWCTHEELRRRLFHLTDSLEVFQVALIFPSSSEKLIRQFLATSVVEFNKGISGGSSGSLRSSLNLTDLSHFVVPLEVVRENMRASCSMCISERQVPSSDATPASPDDP